MALIYMFAKTANLSLMMAACKQKQKMICMRKARIQVLSIRIPRAIPILTTQN